MSFAAIAYTMPQYENFAGYWMKAFEQGTTTPKVMAIDATGDTTAAKFQLNSQGFPVTAGSALVIPFIDGSYDSWLFPTEAEADANDTTNAIQLADDIIAPPVAGQGSTAVQELTTATMTANTNKDYEAGDVVETKAFSTGNGGGATYDVVLTSGVTPNTFNIIIGVADDLISFVLRESTELNAKQFGIKGDGTDENTAISAFEVHIFATKKSAYFPKGTYDTGAANWPFRQSTITSFKDYEGVVVRGDGKGITIFRTTSALGSDVLQLNAVKAISFRDLSCTAILTGSSGAGSNGVSITNGGEDLDLDIDVFDCPGVDQGSFFDGSKGFTLQSGSLTVLPFQNIKIRGKVTNCGFVYNQDAAYEDFDTATEPNYAGIDVDIVGEDCWRGIIFGASAALSALAEDDRDSNITVKATLINCAQNLISSRWVRSRIDVHIITTKTKANLFRPFAADQSVYAAFIDGAFRDQIKVKGRMEECDNKILIGGAVQGGGISGACIGLDVDFELDCPNMVSQANGTHDGAGNASVLTDTTKSFTVNEFVGQTIQNTTDGSTALILSNTATTITATLAGGTDNDWDVSDAYTIVSEVVVLDAGGNTVKDSNIKLTGITDGTGTSLILLSNTVTFGSSWNFGALTASSIFVDSPGNAYTTFEADSATNLISLPRLASGSAGSPDGFVTIRDSATGTNYKIQLFT